MEAERKGKRITKWVGRALLGAVVLSAGWNVWHYYFNAESVSQKEPWNIAQWWLYDKGLDRAIAADNVGGDTPEGAMQGYIAALEAGDIELAAKYYIPTKQREALEKLRDSKAKGFLGKYAGVIKTLDQKIYSTTTNVHTFYRLESDKTRYGETTVVLNSATNKWKIAEP